MTDTLPLLDQFLREIRDAVVVVDAAGRILHQNPAAEALTGWAGEQVIGRDAGTVLAVDPLPTQVPWTSALRAALDSGIAHEYADVLPHARDGARRINQTLYPIPDGRGRILGAAIISRDISHLYPLREERRIAAMAFETAGPLLVASAADLRVVQANPACLQLSQYDERELVGESLEYLYRDPDQQELLAFFRDPGPPDRLAARTERRNRSGQRLQLLETAAKVRDGRGRVTHFVIGLHNLTEAIAATAALREIQLDYRQLMESMHEGVAVIRAGRFIECNTQFAQMMGRRREEVLGRTPEEISGDLQADGATTGELMAAVTAAAKRAGNTWTTWQVRRPDGTTAEFEANITLSTLAGRRVLLVTARDVTDRRRIEQDRQRLIEELAAREKLIRLSNRAYGIASWEYDPATRIMRWSDDAEAVLGLAPGALADGLPALEHILHPDDQAPVAAALQRALRGEGFELDVRIRDRQGRIRWTHTQAEVEADATGRPVMIRGAVADISERRAAQETIERLAFFDPLTGLPNRRLLFDRVKQAVAGAQRRGGGGAVLFIDLDHFKRINDSLGHGAGDQVLIEIAARLRALTRAEDTVARLGGDEFVVLLHDLGAELGDVAQKVWEIAGRILARLSGAYRIGDHDYHLSASIGIALFPGDGEDTLELLHRADAAMYQAKAEGRSTASFYRAELQRAPDTRLAIERELRIALAHRQLELFYQPKVLDGELLVGAEALLRWRHPERGLLSPAEFICVAEQTGLIVDIGAWVIDAACRQLADWNPPGAGDPPLGLSINVSPIQFRQRDLVATVQRALEAHGVEPRLLTLEITEGVLIDRVDEVIDRLGQLKALGVRLSIDDFGTGYSSLAYLRRLPLDELKIDRSFVANLAGDSNNAAIVESMVAIATAFGLAVIAEGVETRAEADLLRRLGCRCHQGYLYARPLPADQFERRWAAPALRAMHR
jgi:diguanylate cyclase (GGDEF)-like protein/PAS domain S-box-containing protein